MHVRAHPGDRPPGVDGTEAHVLQLAGDELLLRRAGVGHFPQTAERPRAEVSVMGRNGDAAGLVGSRRRHLRVERRRRPRVLLPTATARPRRVYGAARARERVLRARAEPEVHPVAERDADARGAHEQVVAVEPVHAGRSAAARLRAHAAARH